MKSKLFASRKFFAAALGAVCALCLALGLCFSALNGKRALAEGSADGAVPEYTYVIGDETVSEEEGFRLEGSTYYYKDSSAGWTAAVEQSLIGLVEVKQASDWTASTQGETTSFGQGTGFTDGEICVPRGAQILLDLNGHAVDRALSGANSENGSVFVVEGKLTVTDTVGAGVIRGGAALNGGAFLVNGGSLTVNGGKVAGNNAENGGGVYVDSGSFSLNGGEISENTASKNGGGVYLAEGDLTVSLGSIKNNTAVSGGGIYVGTYDTATVRMSGGEAVSNEASANGKDIYLNQAPAFEISGTPVIGELYLATSAVITQTGALNNGADITLKAFGEQAGLSVVQGTGEYALTERDLRFIGYNGSYAVVNGEENNFVLSEREGDCYTVTLALSAHVSADRPSAVSVQGGGYI